MKKIQFYFYVNKLKTPTFPSLRNKPLMAVLYVRAPAAARHCCFPMLRGRQGDAHSLQSKSGQLVIHSFDCCSLERDGYEEVSPH